METILGVSGANYVMLAADTTQAKSIVIMRKDENKIHKIADNLIMATIGDAGDSIQFSQFISKNIALYKMRNSYDLSPKCSAHFTRKTLANSLRSTRPYQVNMFVAGYDEEEGPQLHYIDYLANAKYLKCGGQGYGSFFCASIFDRYYRPNLTQDEAYELLQKCVDEIQKRLVINLGKFCVAVVDANGVRYLPSIVAKNVLATAT